MNEEAQTYDSRRDTLDHIENVRGKLAKAIDCLAARSLVHDQSKLVEPEKSVFDRVTPRLRGLTYGSPEYHEQLGELKVALDHHYASNSHHPEHFENGVNGMTLLDLIEMFCDWKAATERHADGSLEKSIQINRKRFAMSDQLAEIFENTRRELEW